ncbi:Queuine tRNA-ribosyltransferase subunit QTRTD1-like protein, partial [Stegodyphus mimosarum]
MKFVESVNNIGRIGVLSEFPKPWSSETFKTPMLYAFTRAGTVPHLTFNTLKRLELQNMFVLQTLPTTVEFKDAVENQGKGLSAFIGLPEYPFHLSVQDPATITPHGYNVRNGVSVWCHGGKKLLSVVEYMKIVKEFRPASYQALCDSDTPENCSKKRLNKSVDHSLIFLDECLNEHANCEELKNTAIFGTIQGGYDMFLRKKSAQETALRSVDGFVIDGFHINGPDVQNIDFSKIKPILQEIVSILPKDKPRILHGAFGPEAMLEAVKCGIDIFDSSYSFVLTEAGEASVYPLTIIDEYYKEETNHFISKRSKCSLKLCLKEDSYKSDFFPILKSCECYTCLHYTRAYIHHLLVTSELLA